MTAQVQRRVEAYWNRKPCDSEFSKSDTLSRQFFAEVEAERYRLQSHIPSLLDQFRWEGKRVLEIGTGVGTDARYLIERGAIYTGINIDAGSTLATATALRTYGLPGRALQCDATQMQFGDECFDFVYSFGVLHHIPRVQAAMSEIMRVLKPGGEVLAMLYNRDSINYALEIRLLRKLGAQLLRLPGLVDLFASLGFPSDKLERHRALAQRAYRMSDEEWISRNTDGPDNPYSRVYDAAEVRALFTGFDISKQEVFYFNYEHWGVLGRLLPRHLAHALGQRWGWHRIVHATKRDRRNVR